MTAYKDTTHRLTVPRGAGIPGFLRTIEGILRLPRVKSLAVDSKGMLSYVRAIPETEEDPDPIRVELDTLLPGHAIRSSEVVEVPMLDQSSPLRSVVKLLVQAQQDGLHPVAFVSGPGTPLWRWLEEYEGYPPGQRDTLLGHPYYEDEYPPPYGLFLCASEVRGGALADVQKTYKLLIPENP